jgi:hypothetical protein
MTLKPCPARLRDVAHALGMEVGCSEGSCVWGGPIGMHTNAGCRCLSGTEIEIRLEARRMQRVAKHLLDALAPVLPLVVR